MFSDENQLKSTTLTSSKVVPQLKIGFKKSVNYKYMSHKP